MACGYDIIGDIHGYASKLEILLRKLGYELRANFYAHPHRQAIFVGDYVDRGPEIRRALQIVHAMVQRGTAYAVMGNHEFNALAYNTYAEGIGWLRERNEANRRQYAQTLIQVAGPFPVEWQQWLKWFGGLPLSLELEGIRVVHAAWHDEDTRFFLGKQPITRELMIAMSDVKTAAGSARERLLSGVKIALPPEHYFTGKSGEKKQSVRAKWWMEWKSKSYREVAFPSSAGIPAVCVPDSLQPPSLKSYSASEPPVFIGHYWLPFEKPPEPVAVNIACLDYSIAGGGPLVAYSWNGEQMLRKENFVLA
jgi:hypothetical protein